MALPQHQIERLAEIEAIKECPCCESGIKLHPQQMCDPCYQKLARMMSCHDYEEKPK